MNFNKVILGGYLTRDPEIRYATNGKAVANFSIATNRSWTTETGERKEETTFVDCTAWGRTGEVIGQHFRKGKPILIDGRLRQEQWTDKQTGANRSRLTVTVEAFSFAGDKADASEPAETARPARPAPRGAAATRTAPAAKTDDGLNGPPNDDDVPF